MNQQPITPDDNLVLPDTSLAAIVRDEKMNPAGGIRRFVESHVPYVEEAVIVDTGSVDGTREILEELQSQYPNLSVFDRKFNGFADARNYSLKQVRTKRALILDADELITHKTPSNDFEKLRDLISGNPEIDFLRFIFHHVFFDDERWMVSQHNARMFLNDGMKSFQGNVWEKLSHEIRANGFSLDGIYHFLPSGEGRGLKKREFYRPFSMLKMNLSPFECEGFSEWKKYNPKRDNYE